jgi:hypothetical protein
VPQSRIQADYANWTTPRIETLLHQGAHGTLIAESQMESIQATIERILVDETLQITHRRNMPHYALFELETTVAPQGNFLKHLSDKLSQQAGWVIGIHPQTNDNSRLHILVRTADHRQMSLQQVLLRPAFRKSDSAHSIVLGITLEQHIIIRNLELLRHLIVAGDERTTQAIMRNLLATLLLSNTPAQLRVAFLGSESSSVSDLTDTPHTLGKPVHNVAHGILLFNGMLREIRRRQDQMRKAGYPSLLAYNAENPQTALPHILMVINALDSKAWMSQSGKWLSNLSRIIRDGAAVGIHVILVAPNLTNEVLHPVYAGIRTKLVGQAIASDYARHLDNFHESLWHFVDALLVENDVMKPVEIPIVTEEDTQTIATYWRKNAEERLQTNRLNNMTQKGGITSLFQKLQQDTLIPTPPVPQTPPAEVLAHAASVLSSSSQLTQNVQDTKATETMIVDDYAITFEDENVEETSTETAQVTDISDEVSIQFEAIRRAHALASYLGWLGRGPLMDILGLSVREAELIIAILQARQILERSDTPTPRLRSSQMR